MPDAPARTARSPLEEAAMAAYEDWQRTTFHPSAHPQWTQLTPETKRLWLSAQRAAIQAYLRARAEQIREAGYPQTASVIEGLLEIDFAAELDPPADPAGEQGRG